MYAGELGKSGRTGPGEVHAQRRTGKTLSLHTGLIQGSGQAPHLGRPAHLETWLLFQMLRFQQNITWYVKKQENVAHSKEQNQSPETIPAENYHNLLLMCMQMYNRNT